MSEFTLEERVLLRTYCPAERSKRKRGSAESERSVKRRSVPSTTVTKEVMSADMLRTCGALDAIKLLPESFYQELTRLNINSSQGKAWVSRRDGGTPSKPQPLCLELCGASSAVGGHDTLVLWLTMPTFGDRFVLNISSEADDSKFVIWHYRQALNSNRRGKS